MKFKILSSAIIGLVLCLSSCSQKRESEKMDSLLTSAYKNMNKMLSNYEHEINTDSIRQVFKDTLSSELKKQITFDSALDSLSKYIKISASPDKKIKFYSWDKLDGGTWHSMEVLAQFKSDEGIITVQPLVTNQTKNNIDYTDCLIDEVNEFTVDSTKYYLTFGWGTYGSGMQHRIVQVFKSQATVLPNVNPVLQIIWI